MKQPLLIAGCMSGTSLDGVDAALCRVDVAGGCDVDVVGTHSVGFGALGDGLRELASGVAVDAGRIAEMAWRLGEVHVACLRPLLEEIEEVDLVVAHGQTVFHGGTPRRSWQLLNPVPIAAALGVRVLSDLRQGDLALGGEGAPITPLADAMLFGARSPRGAVVNLGGFCNVTLLGDPVRGFDVCACNQVLDGVARRMLGQAFDQDGAAAASGKPVDELVDSLVALLTAQRQGGRSLGTGDEMAAWVEAAHRGARSAGDVCASACTAIGRCIGAAVGAADPVILAGGGVRNGALVSAIGASCSGDVLLSDAMGVPSAYREAVCMAVLGGVAMRGGETTLPAVTGRREGAVVAGTWTG